MAFMDKVKESVDKAKAERSHGAFGTVQPSETGVSSEAMPLAWSAKFLERWWVWAPARLNRYSSMLAVAWQDGIYLTVWPRVGIFLPVGALLLGMVAGTFHWQFLSISEWPLGHLPAIVFAQSLPLLILAVLLGTLSANAGLMLVLGFALADYISGPPFPYVYSSSLAAKFVHARVPQLATYLLFFALAVVPVVMTNSLLAGLHRRWPGKHLALVLGRSIVAALVQSLMIYEWTFIAAMSIHAVWAWNGNGSPVTVATFHKITAPWLVLAVVTAIAARTVLTLRAHDNPDLLARLRSMLRAYVNAAKEPATFVRRYRWPRATATAVWMTLLPLGFIASPLLAAEILCAVLTLLLVRSYVLPSMRLWQQWSRRLSKVPAIFRLTAAVVGGYFVTLSIVGPGRQFDTRGFDLELISMGIGVLLLIALLPHGFGVSKLQVAQRGITNEVRAWSPGRTAFIMLGVLLLSSKEVFAQCDGPGCCLVSGALSALGTSGFLPSFAGGVPLDDGTTRPNVPGAVPMDQGTTPEQRAQMFAKDPPVEYDPVGQAILSLPGDLIHLGVDAAAEGISSAIAEHGIGAGIAKAGETITEKASEEAGAYAVTTTIVEPSVDAAADHITGGGNQGDSSNK